MSESPLHHFDIELFDVSPADIRAAINDLEPRLDGRAMRGWELASIVPDPLRPFTLLLTYRCPADDSAVPTVQHQIEIHSFDPALSDYERMQTLERALADHSAHVWDMVAMCPLPHQPFALLVVYRNRP